MGDNHDTAARFHQAYIDRQNRYKAAAAKLQKLHSSHPRPRHIGPTRGPRFDGEADAQDLLNEVLHRRNAGHETREKLATALVRIVEREIKNAGQ